MGGDTRKRKVSVVEYDHDLNKSLQGERNHVNEKKTRGKRGSIDDARTKLENLLLGEDVHKALSLMLKEMQDDSWAPGGRDAAAVSALHKKIGNQLKRIEKNSEGQDGPQVYYVCLGEQVQAALAYARSIMGWRCHGYDAHGHHSETCFETLKNLQRQLDHYLRMHMHGPLNLQQEHQRQEQVRQRAEEQDRQHAEEQVRQREEKNKIYGTEEWMRAEGFIGLQRTRR